MGWYGKLIGTALGAIIGRGLLGAIVGFVIGHLFDQRARAARASRAMPSRDLQSAFFRATFQVMGHAAKADGRVTEQEIDAARNAMRRFSLSDADVRRAIDLYTEGKSPDFPLDDVLRDLRIASTGRDDLRRLFVQIQLEAALQGGGLNPSSRAVFARICNALGISPIEFAALEAMLRMRGQAGSAGPGRADAESDVVRLDFFQVFHLMRRAALQIRTPRDQHRFAGGAVRTGHVRGLHQTQLQVFRI